MSHGFVLSLETRPSNSKHPVPVVAGIQTMRLHPGRPPRGSLSTMPQDTVSPPRLEGVPQSQDAPYLLLCRQKPNRSFSRFLDALRPDFPFTHTVRRQIGIGCPTPSGSFRWSTNTGMPFRFMNKYSIGSRENAFSNLMDLSILQALVISSSSRQIQAMHPSGCLLFPQTSSVFPWLAPNPPQISHPKIICARDPLNQRAFW